MINLDSEQLRDKLNFMDDYLKKKYLDNKVKIKSKKRTEVQKKCLIIDDDLDINKIIYKSDDEVGGIYEDLKENQPVIEDIKILNATENNYANMFWKPIKSGNKHSNSAVDNKRHDSDSDIDVKPDINLLQTGRHDSDSDLDIPRGVVKTEGYNSDLSPPRDIKQETHNSDSDLSPCRGIKVEKGEEDSNRVRINFRDLKTKKSKPNPLEAEHMKRYQEIKASKEGTYKIWGKGVKQIEERRTELADISDVVSKPLSRHIDEQDLDKMLRKKVHEDDPLLSFFQKDRTQQPSKPKYKGSYPPNRYNIQPGYRWDGVDRSNGFETRMFQRMANKTATREIAYKWSVEDM